MMAYIIITSSAFATRKEIQDYLDSIKEVQYWYACLPDCVFCTSSLMADELAQKLRARFGRERFLVMECNDNRQGWLPRAAWHLMRHPDSPMLDGDS